MKGSNPRVSGMFLKAFVQAVLFFLYGDVGYGLPYRSGPRGTSAQGLENDNREATKAASG